MPSWTDYIWAQVETNARRVGGYPTKIRLTFHKIRSAKNIETINGFKLTLRSILMSSQKTNAMKNIIQNSKDKKFVQIRLGFPSDKLLK